MLLDNDRSPTAFHTLPLSFLIAEFIMRMAATCYRY